MREANVPSVPKCDKQIQVTGKSQPCQIRDHQICSIPGIVHTTGNSHPGGDKGGLFNVENTFIPFLVKKPETAPVARGTAMQVISFLVSFFKNIPLSGLRRSADSIHFLCLLYFRMTVSIQSYTKKKQLCFYAELFLFVDRLKLLII